MISVVLLSVLTITCTTVVARPSDRDFKTKRSANEESDEVFNFNPSAIKFPTEIQAGFIVTINGTINTKSDALEVVFPSASGTDCKLIYNFEKGKIDVSPSPPNVENSSDYELTEDWKQTGVPPTFSIRLMARTVNERNMFNLTFEAADRGPSNPQNCPVGKFETYSSIEFKNGVNNITSLLFQFM